VKARIEATLVGTLSWDRLSGESCDEAVGNFRDEIAAAVQGLVDRAPFGSSVRRLRVAPVVVWDVEYDDELPLHDYGPGPVGKRVELVPPAEDATVVLGTGERGLAVVETHVEPLPSRPTGGGDIPPPVNQDSIDARWFERRGFRRLAGSPE